MDGADFIVDPEGTVRDERRAADSWPGPTPGGRSAGGSPLLKYALAAVVLVALVYAGSEFHARWLAHAAVAAVETECSSPLDPDVAGALAKLRARLSRWFTAGFTERWTVAARQKIAATTLARARGASDPVSATELSRWLQAAATAACDVDGEDFTEAVRSLVAKCDVLLGAGQAAEAHAALTRVEAGFSWKYPACSWQAARSAIDRCLALKGVRVPDEGALWNTFARAGFIPLPEDSKARANVFEVTVSIEHGKQHRYGDRFAIPSSTTPFIPGLSRTGESRCDSKARITGEFRDSDGTRQFVLTASGFEIAPASLRVRMENFKEVPGSTTPTQGDIDADAKRLGINDLCEQLSEKLAAPDGR